MTKRHIPIEKLLVNPENPRFEPVKNQQEAINLMVSQAGKTIINLGKDIAQHGLNPSKSLMVVETDNGFYLPLEGNRRIVALKLLHNPDQTTNKKLVDYFKELHSAYGQQIPKEVECTIFPDKKSAFRWVNLEHTGKNKGVGILKWDSTQRQRFIAQYAGRVPSRTVQLFDYADNNNLEHDKVDATTLERIISTPFIRKQIGINFPKGYLDFEKTQSHVIKNLKRVFVEMSKKEFKVADVYTSDKSKSWINNLLASSSKAKVPNKTIEGDIAKNKDPLAGKWITNELYNKYPYQNRIKSILGELKEFHPKTNPNVCAISMRVLMELAVYVFLDKKGEIKNIIDIERARLVRDNAKRKKQKELEKNWAPSFNRMLSYMANKDDIITDPQKRKALGVFIGKKSVEPFMDELNLFIHNPHYNPSADSVFEIWEKLGKLIFSTILNI